MSEADAERQRELERMLLRSARLDVPQPSARERALAGALGALEASRPSWARAQLGVLAGAVAVAAMGALLLRGEPRSPENGQLQPEPARATGSASNAPARVLPLLAPCPKLTVAQGGALLIDDFEDRNARLAIADGRDGTWMVFNDGSGKQVPPGFSPLHPERLAKARGDSRYSLHTSGGKFSIWGSVVIGTLTDGGCYDASAYSGVEFWAKGNTRIHAQLSVIDELAVENGGLCAEKKCYGAPQKVFDLVPQWRKYSLSFAELLQLNEGKKFRFDPKRLVSFNISIHGEDTPFDVWIDDVRFNAPP